MYDFGTYWQGFWFEPAAIRLPLLSTLTEAGETVDIEDAKHILQSDKLLGDKIDEVVKEWDAQKEEFYERTGLSRGNELAVIDNDESGVEHHEYDDFDELTQLLEWRVSYTWNSLSALVDSSLFSFYFHLSVFNTAIRNEILYIVVSSKKKLNIV